MADQAAQDYQSHRMYVPGFHIAAFGILVINFLWTLYGLIWGGGGIPGRVDSFLLAIGLLLLFLYVRQFPLRVQDRVIILEEKLRLGELLPPELRSRITELTRGQLIALRFASDAEVPALARKVLDEKITGREDIKKLIKDWRPDHLRA
jgi:Family of unknown function (DUF6526)